MSKLRIYRFQTKVKIGSLKDKLVKFLKEPDKDVTETECIWQALFAFWLLEALINDNTLTDEELIMHGLSAIRRLEVQIIHVLQVLSSLFPAQAHLFYSNLAPQPESLTSSSNGLGNRAHPRTAKHVKTYTEIDGLDDEHTDESSDKVPDAENAQRTPGTVTEQDLNGSELPSQANTMQFSKTFKV